jgi:Ni,Fe-hydrogenase I cytochrome b subunit
MTLLQRLALKLVRWTGWLLVPVIIVFFVTGYAVSGRYGFSAVTDERTALTVHKLMHVPLGTLVIAHIVPSTFLALVRWGWIKPHS